MENRKRILREVESVCPVHGAHKEDELVRLASGERICPDCFREAVRDSLG
jgi:RNA polymerase subunit RPABC4/transcription elongation factor Spt4